jgi:hypothetical protein
LPQQIHIDEVIAMSKREGRVYFSAKKGQRETLIVFDRGYPYMAINIYELRESIELGRIEREIAEALGLNSLPDVITKNVVEYWVEKRFGKPTASWKITE